MVSTDEYSSSPSDTDSIHVVDEHPECPDRCHGTSPFDYLPGSCFYWHPGREYSWHKFGDIIRHNITLGVCNCCTAERSHKCAFVTVISIRGKEVFLHNFKWCYYPLLVTPDYGDVTVPESSNLRIYERTRFYATDEIYYFNPRWNEYDDDFSWKVVKEISADLEYINGEETKIVVQRFIK